MGWQDRSYYRDSSHGTGNPLMWLLTGSVPLFRAFGIHVRMHASMVVVLALLLLTSSLSGGIGFTNALTFALVLSTVVLLHEFGHCFAARSVGGDARQIMMWPLGGLAFAEAPRRPWPQIVTTIGGPLVNVAICLITGLALTGLAGSAPDLPLNPLQPRFTLPGHGTLNYFLWFFFIVSWANLMFNLLPIYPLDGGRLLQEVLWCCGLTYYRSMLIATSVGMAGAALMGVYGMIHLSSWYGLILMLVGIDCFRNCYYQRAMLKAAGPWEAHAEHEPDYAASLYEPETPRHKHLSKRLLRKAQKSEARDLEEKQKVDRILEKVSAHGISSLSWWERRILKRATEHQRRQELELKEVERKLY